MSILIKGMKMPQGCNDCPLAGDFKCNLMPSVPALCKEYDIAVQNGKRLNSCPLIEIPPHGRLIDADTLVLPTKLNDWNSVTDYIRNITDVWGAIDAAPTIIEAEEGER